MYTIDTNCYGVEMKRALERHDQGKARVIPIILRPVNWQETAFSKLQVLPQDAIPVTRWSSRDEAFSNIAMSIEKNVKDFFSPDQLPMPLQQTPFQAKQRFFQQGTSHVPFSQTPIFSSPHATGAQSQTALPNILLPSGIFPPSTTHPISPFIQREDEMFEKDVVFEEYILERIQRRNIPSTWRIFQPPHSRIIMWGLFFAITVFACFIMVMLLTDLTLAEVTTQNNRSFSLILWSILLGVILGSLTYGANWLYWSVKKKTLVLTPKGFIYFERGTPRYVVKFRVVRSISFKTCDSDLFLFITDKILTVKTNLLTIEINLTSFATPEIIAQHIDDAYTLYVIVTSGRT